MLCSLGERTCGACCFGPAVSREALAERLRRHGRAFARLGSRTTYPSVVSLVWHELEARRGADLVWAPLLRWPVLGRWLRDRLRSRAVCAFLGYLDEREDRIGCLIHPSRWGGRDDRPETAYRLLEGVGCGSSEYFCPGSRRFAEASRRAREDFEHRTRGMDWYRFSSTAPAFDVPLE